jgi:predicted enzyme related to lactoylglutathione lyase
MAVTGLAFTMYPVTDVARASSFYSDVLGLHATDVKTDFWAEFDIAGATFGVGSFPQAGKPGTANALVLQVSSMAEMRAHLNEHGVTSTEPFETQVCWLSMLHDPDGNEVWLHESKTRA